MSILENVEIAKNVSAAVSRGDKQGPLASPAEHVEWIEDSGFRDDILRGLSGHRRSVPSRWLYDDRGSELFEEITRLKEYYPTRTETKILRDAAKPIAAFVGPRTVVVEYGAGAAVKTALLLAALDRPAEYLAVDVAGDFMSLSVARLGSQFPGLKVGLQIADFTRDFDLPGGLGIAPFRQDAYRHEARWNPDELAVEMHIVSIRPQVVTIAGIDFSFGTGDSIHTESSRKYDAQSFTRLAELGGWDVAELWTDADRLFAIFGLVAVTPAKGK